MAKLVSKEKLLNWLNGLSEKYEVWVPREENGYCRLAPYEGGGVIEWERKPRFSAKEAVFPQSERLLSFNYRKDKDNPENVTVELSAEEDAPKRVLFGVLPCDVAGIDIMEKVFSDKHYQDPYFRRRRENTCLVALGCREPENTCFCTAVGGSPAEAPAADILLTRIGDGFALEALTDKGRELAGEASLAGLKGVDQGALDRAKAEAPGKLSAPFRVVPDRETADKLLEHFDSPYWKEITAGCLSCGICTYVCPTCHCFTIADEDHGMCGERQRCWDACMFPVYTLEASGHNPRLEKWKRYRNRINHKYSYLVKNNGLLGCTGCGRCIKLCPAGIDLRRIITDLLGED